MSEALAELVSRKTYTYSAGSEGERALSVAFDVGAIGNRTFASSDLASFEWLEPIIESSLAITSTGLVE